jgi:DNA-binding IclR family transcriptional regulator
MGIGHMGSLDKVFLVMEEVVALQGPGASFSEVQVNTGLPRSTVHRVLKNLTEMGYLNYSPDNRRYRGSIKLANLGAEVMANFNLRDYVHPFLLKLQRESDFRCNAGIMDGDFGVYIDMIDTHDFGVKLYGEVGMRFRLHCAALGKVLLAFGGDAAKERILSLSLPAVTSRSITDPAKLREQFREVKKNGYALDDEEVTRGIMCLAAPVFGLKGELVCAISITFPKYVAEENGIAHLVEMIKRCAEEISGAS